MLEAEGVGAATEHAALDLVAHEQRAALLGEATGRLQELGRAGMHAALALHALHHDGADGIPLRFEQGLERRHVVDGRAGEAVRQRPERLLFRRLGRGGQRGERAAMEARIERDDDARAAATVASSAPSASARAAARFLACKRASLNAHSFASAPELAKKLRHGVRSASGTHAFSRSDTARATSPRCSM